MDFVLLTFVTWRKFYIFHKVLNFKLVQLYNFMFLNFATFWANQSILSE
jgi:hypothetical protein